MGLFEQIYGSSTQIIAEMAVTNTTGIIYTVPAGKVFHLVDANLKTNAGAAGVGDMSLHDSDTIHIRHICFVDVRSNNQGIVNMDHFDPAHPMKLTAGQYIEVESDTGSLEAEGDIFGFESNA